MSRESMTTEGYLARLGAVASVLGVVVLAVSTFLHPIEADPNDAPAAFAEYAADQLWVWSHLGQFAGIVLLGVGLVGLAATMEAGTPAAAARIATIGTAATVATAAVLQAVDGIALKVMVDRWAAAEGAERDLAFEGTLAVRQIEIGLAALLPIVFGLTAAAFGAALLSSARYPSWLGGLALAGALAMLATGLAHATTGFSEFAMMLSMVSSLLLVVWFVALAPIMWRRATGHPE